MKRRSKSDFNRSGTGLTALSIVLGSDKAPPSEFRIFRKGENPSEKGTFHFTEASALSVMETYARLNKPMRFDYNHGTLLEAPPTPEASLSAGTFVPEIRDGELWATKCNWTARAASLLTAGEYGEFSPYFDHDKDGVVTRLINCALTNLPALNDIESLVAASATSHQENDMPCAECSALSARLNTMDEECKALKAKLSMFEKKDEDDKTKASALTALTGQSTHATALGTIEGWKTKAGEYDKLKADSDAREATALRAGLTTILDQASEAGKIPPAKKSAFEARALALGGGKPSKEGNEWLSALVADLPKLVITGEGTGAAAVATAGGEVALTVEEKATAARHGISEKSMLTAKQQRATRLAGTSA